MFHATTITCFKNHCSRDKSQPTSALANAFASTGECDANMEFFHNYEDGNKTEKCRQGQYQPPGSDNIFVQLGLSLILGVSAFVAFCVWKFGISMLISLPLTRTSRS